MPCDLRRPGSSRYVATHVAGMSLGSMGLPESTSSDKPSTSLVINSARGPVFCATVFTSKHTLASTRPHSAPSRAQEQQPQKRTSGGNSTGSMVQTT